MNTTRRHLQNFRNDVTIFERTNRDEMSENMQAALNRKLVERLLSNDEAAQVVENLGNWLEL